MASTLATTSLAPRHWVARASIRPDATGNADTPSEVAASSRGRAVLRWLEDAGLLLRLVGTPVALFVRLLLVIARRE